MAGAAFLSAKAAYLTGAGLVKIFTEEANRVILQQLLPEAVLEIYDDGDFDAIAEEAENSAVCEAEKYKNVCNNLHEQAGWADVIVAGPGLGTSPLAEAIVAQILSEETKPVVLDADALNILANHLDWLKAPSRQIRILTPHLGEMARLTRKSIFDIQKQLLQVARDFAKEYNVICVLKDARTIIALPDQNAWINTNGNSGMATAGSGDVLAGTIGGLMAQGMDGARSAYYGVYVHAAAADEQCKKTGIYGLMAQDILAGIPQVTGKWNKIGKD